MPFAGFKDFDECISKMRSKGHDMESAKNICGSLKHKHEGKKAPAKKKASKKNA